MVDTTSLDDNAHLFLDKAFKSHSGIDLSWKINVDALSYESLACIAKMFMNKFRDWSFHEVYGIPNGGLELAEAFHQYARKDGDEVLIVDDVYTTGKSMEEARKLFGKRPTTGVVLFARATPPTWIIPIFSLNTLLDDQNTTS
jgi:hypothetical protein